jgi:hypothetical protein
MQQHTVEAWGSYSRVVDNLIFSSELTPWSRHLRPRRSCILQAILRVITPCHLSVECTSTNEVSVRGKSLSRRNGVLTKGKRQWTELECLDQRRDQRINTLAAFGISTKENALKVTIRILYVLFMYDDKCSLLLDRTKHNTKGNTERKPVNKAEIIIYLSLFSYWWFSAMFCIFVQSTEIFYKPFTPENSHTTPLHAHTHTHNLK